MKKILQPILALTIISAVCAAVLAVVNGITQARIASLSTLKANNAAKAVLPSTLKVFETRPDPVETNQTILVAFTDASRQKVAGYAVSGVSANGYGGAIRLMVGLDADRKVFTYQVLVANETPGLGAKLGEDEFVKRFNGKPALSLAVKKDGGDIDAITGATITSRAVCDAIANAAARVDRLEGKKPAAAAPAKKAAADPEGTLLFNPAEPKEALAVMPKGTATATAITKDRFPIFEGKDASGKVTGYAVVGTGKARGPNGELVLHVLFGAMTNRMPSFNPPPRTVNKPGIEMTDMENAQRMAFNAAMQDAIQKLRKLPR